MQGISLLFDSWRNPGGSGWGMFDSSFLLYDNRQGICVPSWVLNEKYEVQVNESK